MICYACHKEGHRISECKWLTKHYEKEFGQKYSDGMNDTKRDDAKRDDKRVNHVMITENDDDDHQGYDIENVISNFSTKTNNVNYDSNLWYFDSGDNVHLSGSRNYFIDYTPFDGNNKNITINGVSNGFTAQAIGVGTCKLVTIVNGKKHDVILKDVLHVPGLRWNLISWGMINEQGYEIEYINNRREIKVYDKDDECVMKMNMENYLWPLRTVNGTNGWSRIVNALITGSNQGGNTASLALWHERLGHVNTRYIIEMQSKNLVDGLKLTSNRMNTCDTCFYAKQRAQTYHTNNYRNVKAANDLIFIDLMDFGGPNPTIFKKVLVIVDAFSNYTSIYLLKSKDETNKYIMEYIAWAGRQLSTKVKRVLSDGGGEFKNQVISDWYKGKGIEHQIVGPNAPQSNPCERANQTIFKLHTAFMKQSGFPRFLWTEAAIMATYVKNRVPCKSTDGKTPYEVFFGHRPSMGHIRKFGCLCYVYVHPNDRKFKSSDRSKIGYLVGMCDSTNRYKIYFPDSRIVKFVADVRFKECEMYCDRNQNESLDLQWIQDDEQSLDQMDDIQYMQTNTINDING